TTPFATTGTSGAWSSRDVHSGTSIGLDVAVSVRTSKAITLPSAPGPFVYLKGGALLPTGPSIDIARYRRPCASCHVVIAPQTPRSCSIASSLPQRGDV